MVTINATQAMHIANVKTARAALRNAKAYSEARAKEIVATEMGAYQAALDHEVRLAFSAGVPKAQIRRDGLGTTDSKTLEDILKRTEGAAAALAGKLETDPLAHRYAVTGPGVLTVTLAGQMLAEAGERVDCVGSEIPSTADFQVLERDDGSPYLKTITPGHDAEFNAHPIVAWGRAHEAEALAWLAAREARE